MLPYFEQNVLYNAYNQSLNWSAARNSTAVLSKLNTLLCPSAQQQRYARRRPATHPRRPLGPERRGGDRLLADDRHRSPARDTGSGPGRRRPATPRPSAPGRACSPRTPSRGSRTSPTACPTRSPSPSRPGRPFVYRKGGGLFSGDTLTTASTRAAGAGRRATSASTARALDGSVIAGALPDQLHQRRGHRRPDASPIRTTARRGPPRSMHSTRAGPTSCSATARSGSSRKRSACEVFASLVTRGAGEILGADQF